jgi:hypothetical protein
MSESDEKLLPCPFCGSNAVVYLVESAGLWRVRCCNEFCDIQQPLLSASEQWAIKNWNTRPSADTIPREWWDEVKKWCANEQRYLDAQLPGSYEASKWNGKVMRLMQEIESRSKGAER